MAAVYGPGPVIPATDGPPKPVMDGLGGPVMATMEGPRPITDVITGPVPSTADPAAGRNWSPTFTRSIYTVDVRSQALAIRRLCFF